MYKIGWMSQFLCSDPYGKFSPKDPEMLVPLGVLSDNGSRYWLCIPHSTSSKIFWSFFLQVLFRLANGCLTIQAHFYASMSVGNRKISWTLLCALCWNIFKKLSMLSVQKVLKLYLDLLLKHAIMWNNLTGFDPLAWKCHLHGMTISILIIGPLLVLVSLLSFLLPLISFSST